MSQTLETYVNQQKRKGFKQVVEISEDKFKELFDMIVDGPIVHKDKVFGRTRHGKIIWARIICPDCKGEGYIPDLLYSREFSQTIKCARCNGTGSRK